MTPSSDQHSDPHSRGYLADAAAIDTARRQLAERYKYEFVAEDATNAAMKEAKRPDQCFMGLEAGWAVDLADRLVLKPTDAKLNEYYAQ